MEKYIQDRQPEAGKSDYDILQENHKFIREPVEDDLSKWEVSCRDFCLHAPIPRGRSGCICSSLGHGWECGAQVRMAVKYYNKLFKEYCIADMSRYKTGQIGLRWRTQVLPRQYIWPC